MIGYATQKKISLSVIQNQKTSNYNFNLEMIKM